MKLDCDVAIVGGGLAGGLTALAIKRRWPGVTIALIDAQDRLGGHHRWSWFASDAGKPASDLLAAFPYRDWSDYEVRFPEYRRVLPTPYRSLASRDFDATLRKLLPQDALHLGRRVAELAPGRVTFEDGRRLAARHVVDCRDAPSAGQHLRGGWQVFLGQMWRMDAPHGLRRPIIMDATVAQPGAYRFVYVLPIDEDHVFIEDTYYQDQPNLDARILRERIARYAEDNGWQGSIVDEETGLLPVITGGDFQSYRDQVRVPGVVRIGAGGGFTHPLTSYTMPIAVETALAVADGIDLSPGVLAAQVERRAEAHWRDTQYFRLLGQMLFAAAEPGQRYRIFERFYRLDTSLIERFYAAKANSADKARILVGKPPVPVASAIGALLSRRPALRKPAQILIKEPTGAINRTFR